MFKSDTKCKGCNKTYYIQNKHYHLCSDCVYKKNHNGKDKTQVLKEKTKHNAKHKSQLKVFLEIWNERLHFCIKCGKWLGDTPLAVYFSHIRSKGAAPELKFEKSNIELLCCDCHYQHEFGNKK